MASTQRIRTLMAYRLLHGHDRNEADREELETWLDQSEDHRQVYRRLMDSGRWKEWAGRRSMIRVEDDWALVAGRIATRKIRRWQIYARIASVILLFGAGISAYFYFHPEEPQERVLSAIMPGTTKACLVFNDGKKMDLGAYPLEQAVKRDGVLITADSAGQLHYQTENTPPAKEVRHTLIIPKGGEYILSLEDGTLVHLNSQSVLEFPAHFAGNKREVFLEGEAYFSVHSDKERPFIVHTQGMDVRVTGTVFNVRAYRDEAFIQTTLVNGQVAVITETGEHSLLPEQQAELNLLTKQTIVRQVDTDDYTAWVNGWFVFKDERLEEMMNSLARWYDFEVFYQNPEVRDFVFGGKLNRFGSIEPVLDIIKATSTVEVSVQGKTIVFSAK